MPRLCLALFLFASLAQGAEVLPAIAFRKGEKTTYHSAQDTTAKTVASGRDFTAHSRVRLIKEWVVQEVYTDASALLELTLRHISFNQTGEGGKPMVFDSADPNGSDPTLAQQLGPLVNTPILRLRVASDGRVLDSTPLIGGQQLVGGLPFHLVLPSGGLTEGAGWRAQYQAESPSEVPGVDRKLYAVVQENRVQQVQGSRWLIHTQSQLAAPPASPQEQLGILAFYKKGHVILDGRTGQLLQADLTIGRRVDNFAGPGSSYTLQDRYTEHRDLPMAGR